MDKEHNVFKNLANFCGGARSCLGTEAFELMESSFVIDGTFEGGFSSSWEGCW